MSVRNLDKLFNPESVALIGASPRPGSVGAVIARNLRRAGFAGEMMLVNPKHTTIDGLIVHPNIASLPRTPDLAVIATPAETVPSLIGELVERGTRAAVIITAGFAELGERGHSLQQAILDAAKPRLMRIIGPNCVGIMVPWVGLDATFSHVAAPTGDIAFISQSGAIVTAMLDWAVPRSIGFSHVVSLGDGLRGQPAPPAAPSRNDNFLGCRRSARSGDADLYERASGAAALPDRCCRMAQRVKRELSF